MGVVKGFNRMVQTFHWVKRVFPRTYHGNHLWKQGMMNWSHESEWDDQELNNRMFCHNTESSRILEYRLSCFSHTQTPYVFHSEQNFHLNDATTSPKASFCRVIWRFVVFSRNFICLNVFLFTYVHTPISSDNQILRRNPEQEMSLVLQGPYVFFLIPDYLSVFNWAPQSIRKKTVLP